MTDRSPEGRDLVRAINGALHNACLTSRSVDFVNAYGISTPLHPTINLESSDPRRDLDSPRVAQRHRHRGTFDYGEDRTLITLRKVWSSHSNSRAIAGARSPPELTLAG